MPQTKGVTKQTAEPARCVKQAKRRRPRAKDRAFSTGEHDLPLALGPSPSEKLPCQGRLRWIDDAEGREVVYLKDPETGILTRFFVGLVGLLPIEEQL